MWIRIKLHQWHSVSLSQEENLKGGGRGVIFWEWNILTISKELDQHFTWSEKIETVLQKIKAARFQMLTLRNTIDLKIYKPIYYAYFYFILQYGIELWSVLFFMEKLFKIQKRFLRVTPFST